MTRITVVIEDHADGIHLGQQLAGGRVVAAAQGDHSELLEALEYALPYLQACIPQPRDGANSDASCLSRINAAIAKARGQ